MPHPEVVVEAEGPATVETYTVAFDRDGAPEEGLVVGRLEDGRRFLALTPPDRALLEAMTTREFVGQRGTVRYDREQDRNVFSC